jgi:hypothetical protein
MAALVFLVELYLPAATAERVDVLGERLRAATEQLRREGDDVRVVGSAALPDDEAGLVLLTAPSADAAARVVERAELDADRIVPAIWRAGHPSGSIQSSPCRT